MNACIIEIKAYQHAIFMVFSSMSTALNCMTMFKHEEHQHITRAHIVERYGLIFLPKKCVIEKKEVFNKNGMLLKRILVPTEMRALHLIQIILITTYSDNVSLQQKRNIKFNNTRLLQIFSLGSYIFVFTRNMYCIFKLITCEALRS